MVEGHGWVAHFIMIWWLGSNDDDRLAQPIWDQAWWAVVGRTLYDLEMFRDCNHPAGNLPRHGKIHSERDDFPIEPNHFLSDCPTQKKNPDSCPLSNKKCDGTRYCSFHRLFIINLTEDFKAPVTGWKSMAFLTFHPLRRLNSWDLVTGWFDVLVRSCLVPN